MEGDFVRCWGALTIGAGPLGYLGEDVIGDDETPASVGNINVGGAASAVASGRDHICAVLSGGRVRCWGFPILGYQEDQPIGDDETPASAGDVELGGPASEIAASGSARCARLSTGSVRCWGSSQGSGVVGYGTKELIGDNEFPAEAGDIEIGGVAVRLASGGDAFRMCALLDDGDLRCWGDNTRGALGLGHTDDIGDNEVPADVDPVRVLE